MRAQHRQMGGNLYVPASVAPGINFAGYGYHQGRYSAFRSMRVGRIVDVSFSRAARRPPPRRQQAVIRATGAPLSYHSDGITRFTCIQVEFFFIKLLYSLRCRLRVGAEGAEHVPTHALSCSTFDFQRCL
jgi:hypothetical protein